MSQHTERRATLTPEEIALDRKCAEELERLRLRLVRKLLDEVQQHQPKREERK